MLKSDLKGFGVTHSAVKDLMLKKKLILTNDDAEVIKRNFDNYLMYIWLHLGDTKFNRAGYREATDILQAKIN